MAGQHIFPHDIGVMGWVDRLAARRRSVGRSRAEILGLALDTDLPDARERGRRTARARVVLTERAQLRLRAATSQPRPSASAPFTTSQGPTSTSGSSPTNAVGHSASAK